VHPVDGYITQNQRAMALTVELCLLTNNTNHNKPTTEIEYHHRPGYFNHPKLLIEANIRVSAGKKPRFLEKVFSFLRF